MAHYVAAVAAVTVVAAGLCCRQPRCCCCCCWHPGAGTGSQGLNMFIPYIEVPGNATRPTTLCSTIIGWAQTSSDTSVPLCVCVSVFFACMREYSMCV